MKRAGRGGKAREGRECAVITAVIIIKISAKLKMKTDAKLYIIDIIVFMTEHDIRRTDTAYCSVQRQLHLQIGGANTHP